MLDFPTFRKSARDVPRPFGTLAVMSAPIVTGLSGNNSILTNYLFGQGIDQGSLEACPGPSTSAACGYVARGFSWSTGVHRPAVWTVTVPEPPTLLLVGFGLAAVTVLGWRRRNALIQDHSNARVPRERSLQTLVELLAIAGDDDELSDQLRLFAMLVHAGRAPVGARKAARRRGLLQETRERGPRLASTGRARSGANFEALVAIETQGKPAQRKMHARHKCSSTADH